MEPDIGAPVDRLTAERPQRVPLEGTLVRIVPLDPAHTDTMWKHLRGADELWTYLFDGPFSDRESFAKSIAAKSVSADPLYYAIVDQKSGDALGHASYLRIEPSHRVIEVGSIVYSPALQRTPSATEAMYLMARHAFDDLGYRRYEWKCNALNEPSRRAADRLGFSFEGIFRQHMIIKRRNRDTAWYSMLDTEWPSRKAAFEAWLARDNFEADGRQKATLASLRGSS